MAFTAFSKPSEPGNVQDCSVWNEIVKVFCVFSPEIRSLRGRGSANPSSFNRP